jgi:hypothetical protein
MWEGCTDRGPYCDGHVFGVHIMRHVHQSKPDREHNDRYVCRWSGCNYRGEHRRRLNLHARQHTGLRPFHCAVPGCSYASAMASNLRHHRKTSHARLKKANKERRRERLVAARKLAFGDGDTLPAANVGGGIV